MKPTRTRLSAAIAGVALAALAAVGCSSSHHDGGTSYNTAAASSVASAAQSAGTAVLDEVQKDPGWSKFQAAANQCQPTTGDALTKVVLVDTSAMSTPAKAKVWSARLALAKQFKGNEQTWLDCLKTKLQLTDAQKSSFDTCVGGNVFAFNYKGLSGLQAIWTTLEMYLAQTLLTCYDTSVGLAATATPSPSTSGTGTNSPPAASPSPTTSSK